MNKIYWFRKDLRLEDNTALAAFLQNASDKDKISFVYIKNRNSFRYFGKKRITFLNECITELSDDLNALGYELQIFEGRSDEVFKSITREHGHVELYFNRQVEPYCIDRDNKVFGIISRSGGIVNAFDDTTLLPPGSVTNLEGGQYKVYTPFRNQFMKQIAEDDYSARRVKFKDGLTEIMFKESLRCKSVSDEGSLLRGGRSEGVRMLKDFYSGALNKYKSLRDFPATPGTSFLSAHFHFGTVSIREAFRAANKKLKQCVSETEQSEVRTWMNELLWREFYYHITFSNPQLTYSSFRTEFDKVKWNNNEEHFRIWCEGKTGFPIVDAGMRQLKIDGWMHNRVRMITAMFLTKDLLIDWRLGEKYFAENLIDLDFSSNNGGWQWSASTGVDAQPYFRIFNPYLQSKKFDPEGEYIRKFVPELRDVPPEHIHEPGTMSEDLQRRYGIRIGVDYPLPIVDHMEAKEKAVREFSIASGKIQNED